MEQQPEGSEPETGASEKPETGEAVSPKSETDSSQSDADYWRSQADKYERRAKRNAEAAAELERLKRDSMSEQERVATEAADRAVSEVTARLGGRLVRAEIRAAAEGRLSADQVDVLADRLDIGAFLTAEGDVDESAVRQFVGSIAPAPPTNGAGGPVFPDLGQGARGVPLPLNGDPLEDALRSKLNLGGR
jgi:hypothetical protein